MNSPIVLSDAMLESMLARRAERMQPAGLRASIAQAVDMTPQRRPRLLRIPRWPAVRGPQLRSVLIVAIAALLALLLGMAAVGPRPIDRSVTSTPTPGLRTGYVGGPAGEWPADLVAISAQEAWAANAQGVWHFVEDTWVGPTAPERFRPDALPMMAADLERDRIAIAGGRGVAVLDAGAWTWAFPPGLPSPIRSVAFAPDGSLWALGEITMTSRQIVQFELVGSDWQATPVDCPLGGWLLAATADGAIWSGGFSYTGTWGLARYDGARCTAAPGIGSDGLEVVKLVADPRGGLVAVVLSEQRADAHWRQSIIRFDGSAWQTIKVDENVPGLNSDLAVAPSGDVYLLMDEEILSYGATSGTAAAWQLVASGAFHPWARLSVASDGSVWYSGSAGVDRIVPAGT
jgi:hypothetical protein